MSLCKFSVAVLVYNQENYISQTLDSILSQEHDFPFEIIIGDDGSTDGTRKILLEYEKKYPGVIKLLLNERNYGIIGNYFNIMSHCSGIYVMQCAGDDYWLPGKVSLQIRFMDRNPECGMSYTEARNYYQEKRSFSNNTWGGPNKTFEEFIRGNSVPAATAVLRKNLLDLYTSEVKPGKKLWPMEDYPLWLWFSEKSKIDFIPEVTAIYRVLERSASHMKDFKKDVEFSEAFYDAAEYFCVQFKKDRLIGLIENQRRYALLNFAFKYKDIELIRDTVKGIKIVNLQYLLKIIISKSKTLMKLYFRFYDDIYKR